MEDWFCLALISEVFIVHSSVNESNAQGAQAFTVGPRILLFGSWWCESNVHLV